MSNAPRFFGISKQLNVHKNIKIKGKGLDTRMKGVYNEHWSQCVRKEGVT